MWITDIFQPTLELKSTLNYFIWIIFSQHINNLLKPCLLAFCIATTSQRIHPSVHFINTSITNLNYPTSTFNPTSTSNSTLDPKHLHATPECLNTCPLTTTFIIPIECPILIDPNLDFAIIFNPNHISISIAQLPIFSQLSKARQSFMKDIQHLIQTKRIMKIFQSKWNMFCIDGI